MSLLKCLTIIQLLGQSTRCVSFRPCPLLNLTYFNEPFSPLTDVPFRAYAPTSSVSPLLFVMLLIILFFNWVRWGQQFNKKKKHYLVLFNLFLRFSLLVGFCIHSNGIKVLGIPFGFTSFFSFFFFFHPLSKRPQTRMCIM